MKRAKDAILGLCLCPLDLAQQVFRKIVAFGNTDALLHTEHNTIALFKHA